MKHTVAEDPGRYSADRVRRSTSPRLNVEIDQKTDANILRYSGASPDVIRQRIVELDSEWDVERVLEVNASVFAFTGLVLGVAVHSAWLLLSAGVLLFLFQHGVQGWCPPLPILRRLGIRTRGEIDRERYALMQNSSAAAAAGISQEIKAAPDTDR